MFFWILADPLVELYQIEGTGGLTTSRWHFVSAPHEPAVLCCCSHFILLTCDRHHLKKNSREKKKVTAQRQKWSHYRLHHFNPHNHKLLWLCWAVWWYRYILTMSICINTIEDYLKMDIQLLIYYVLFILLLLKLDINILVSTAVWQLMAFIRANKGTFRIFWQLITTHLLIKKGIKNAKYIFERKKTRSTYAVTS